jgi:hypothetical protein
MDETSIYMVALFDSGEVACFSSRNFPPSTWLWSM